MLIFRFTLIFLLLGAIACFGFYVATGDRRYRTWGLKIVQWAVLAALGFFGVLLLERLL